MSEPPSAASAPTTETTAAPSAAADEEELLAALADDFAARLRRGDHPKLEDYVARHPATLAERVRKVLGAVAMMEQTRSVGGAAAGEGPGTTIGRYKLLERIGEGGFGVVYMAEQQQPVRRKVALKILKPGMDTRQVLARFEAERQALAIMDHPGIARVFDGGMTDSGRPYFVMELVKGVPITDFCDQHHLPPAERLKLFGQACHAVQHAHQKGVIHRDLKPSNVLVIMHDTTPLVKVIDFGVAKALGQELTDKTLFTGFAQLLGTPLYMSPEQAGQSALDVDTRSDIYSLGVLLYELLTGTTPFDKERFNRAAQDEIRRIIREEEPPTPSTRLSESKETLASISAQRQMEPAKLTRLVRGELDWIVMKALEKDRSRRYETATGLARDIERYLRNETVEACPPSAAYRLRKFVRRNKAAMAMTTVLAVALLVVVGSIGWVLRGRSVRHARVAGQVEQILSEVDQLEADQKWAAALASARRAEAVIGGGEADAAAERRVRDRLRDLEFVERLEQIRMQIATWVDGSYDYAGADGAYARAFREYGADVEALPVEASIQRLKTRPALAISIASGLDVWARDLGGVKKEAARSQRLLAVARGIDPEPLRTRLRATYGRPVAEVRNELCGLAESIDVREHDPATLVRLARLLEGVQRADLGVRLARDALVFYPGDFWLHHGLAYRLTRQADYEGALRHYTAARAIRPNSLCTLHNLGLVLYRQKKLDEAAATFRRAIEIDPAFTLPYSGLGVVLRDRGELEESVATLRKSIEINPKNPWGYNALGYALWKQEKMDEAIAAFCKANEVDPEYGSSYDSLARLLATCSDPKFRDLPRAVSLAEKAVALLPEEAECWKTLSIAYYRTGDWHRTLDALQKVRETRPIKDEERTNPFYQAMTLWQIGEKDEARRWYDRGVAWMDKNLPDHPQMIEIRTEASALLGVKYVRQRGSSTDPATTTQSTSPKP